MRMFGARKKKYHQRQKKKGDLWQRPPVHYRQRYSWWGSPGKKNVFKKEKRKKKVTCDKDPSCTIGSDTVDEDVRAREMKSKKKEKEKWKMKKEKEKGNLWHRPPLTIGSYKAYEHKALSLSLSLSLSVTKQVSCRCKRNVFKEKRKKGRKKKDKRQKVTCDKDPPFTIGSYKADEDVGAK